MHAAGEYQCLEQRAYADLVCDVIERLPPEVVIQRLTGDPHKHELVAPLWALAKVQTLELIQRRLEERNTWQGKMTEVAS